MKARISKNSVLHLSAFVIIASNLFIKAQNQTQLFTYNSFISHIKQNHPEALRATNLGSIGELQRKAAAGNFDPMVSSGYETKQLNQQNYFSYLQGEIKQPLFASQYLKAGYELGNGTYLNPENKTSAYGLPFLGIELGLLQGFIIDKRRADLQKSTFYEQLYKAESKIALNNLYSNAALAYSYQLCLKKQLQIHNYFIQLAQLRLQGIKDLSVTGERPVIDTVEAAILTQTRLVDLQQTQIEEQKNTALLYSYLWPQPGFTNLPFLSDTLDLLFEAAQKYYLQNSVIKTNENPLISNYNAKQKIVEVDQLLKKEQLKPRLDFRYNLLATNVGGNASFSTENYKWGASLTFPLFLRTPRFEYKIAKLQVANIEMEMNTKKNELELKEYYTKQAIELAAQQIKVLLNNIEYTKMLVNAELLKYKNGESTLFLLNSRESKWLETELKLIEYKFKFIKSVIELIHIRGDLQYQL